jgi:predicted DNA-binding transcriptional regulator AlpA
MSALLLRGKDVEREFGITVKNLETWRASGRGPAFVKLGRKMVVYRREDVETWIAANRVDPERLMLSRRLSVSLSAGAVTASPAEGFTYPAHPDTKASLSYSAEAKAGDHLPVPHGREKEAILEAVGTTWATSLKRDPPLAAPAQRG